MKIQLRHAPVFTGYADSDQSLRRTFGFEEEQEAEAAKQEQTTFDVSSTPNQRCKGAAKDLGICLVYWRKQLPSLRTTSLEYLGGQ